MDSTAAVQWETVCLHPRVRVYVREQGEVEEDRLEGKKKKKRKKKDAGKKKDKNGNGSAVACTTFVHTSSRVAPATG